MAESLPLPIERGIEVTGNLTTPTTPTTTPTPTPGAPERPKREKREDRIEEHKLNPFHPQFERVEQEAKTGTAGEPDIPKREEEVGRGGGRGREGEGGGRGGEGEGGEEAGGRKEGRANNTSFQQYQGRGLDDVDGNRDQPDRHQLPSLPVRHLEKAMECALTCGVCLREFDGEYRRPILLPQCGHTFCRACVKTLELKGTNMYCPSCRHEYRNPEVDDFPINFNIQIIASSDKTAARKKPTDVSECPDHGIRYAFWCRSCEMPACGECLYECHQQPTHGVCRIQDVVMEIKSRAEVLVNNANEDARTQLAESLKRVLQGISDLQEASHILQEGTRISRRVPGSSTLPAITSIFESAKKMKRRADELKFAGGGGGDGSVGGACGGGGGGSGDGSGFGDELASLSPSRASFSSFSSNPSLDSLRAGMSGRPVVVALSETGGLAQVKVEEMGLHLYSIRPASTAYSVAVKLNVLLACINKVSPRVFLDIKAGERPLGRVYISLWGEMKRAQQFLALCLGTFGPCYRDTRFDGVNGRGEPGEYIRGGDYTGKQGLGGEALMDNLEWGGQWTKPMRAGQVCGVGGEEKHRFGALYAICLRDNPSNFFRAPFGMVLSGMPVLEVASRHDPFNMVRVADCGVVIDV